MYIHDYNYKLVPIIIAHYFGTKSNSLPIVDSEREVNEFTKSSMNNEFSPNHRRLVWSDLPRWCAQQTENRGRIDFW